MLGQERDAMACVVGGRAGRRGMKPTGGSLGGMVVVTLERAPSVRKFKVMVMRRSRQVHSIAYDLKKSQHPEILYLAKYFILIMVNTVQCKRNYPRETFWSAELLFMTRGSKIHGTEVSG